MSPCIAVNQLDHIGEFHPGNPCFVRVSHCYINIASLFSVYYSNVIPEYHGDSELSFA